MQTISAHALKKEQEGNDNSNVLIDVTRETFFDAHHIPGAINVPYRARYEGSSKNIFVRLCEEQALPEDAAIIVYSEHPGCRLAYMAGQALEGLGYTNVRVVADGLHGWIAAGGETEPENVKAVNEVPAVEQLDEVSSALMKDGYFRTKLSDETLTQKAGEAFTEFITLPFDVLGEFSPLENQRAENMCTHVGYRSYAQPEAGRPTQELFVYSPQIDDMYKAQIEAHPEAQAFVRVAHTLHAEALIALKEALAKMEKTFPGISDAFFPKDKEPIASIWFLKYPYVASDSEGYMPLCRPHFDFGACTLALGESSPGLRIGVDQEHLEFPKRDKNEVLMLPAIDFFRVSHPSIKPVWHDVLQQRDTEADEGKVARWSAVFFVDHCKGDVCTVCNDTHSVLY